MLATSTLDRAAGPAVQAAPNMDVCGRTAVGPDGHRLGTVEDVLIDQPRDAAYLLVLAEDDPDGTILLIPCGEVTQTTQHVVHVGRSRDEVMAAPSYDPGIPEAEYLAQVARYYDPAAA